MKTGMDGPQEGNNSMHGRKEGRAVLPLSNSQRALAIPDRRPKWRVTAPTARHTKDVHMFKSKLTIQGSLMDKVGNILLCQGAI